jgi:broad specificity phosphatase PhoE
METRLLFVRHAESVCGVEGVFGGPHSCRGLTAPGREQAARLGKRLAAELQDAPRVSVYSSTLRRAVETAAVIAAALDVAPAQDCGLCTWHVPDWADGQPKQLVQAEHALAGGGIYRPFETGNETWAELVARVSRAVLDIADRHRNATVVLVGHSETVEVSFHALGMLPLYRSFDLRIGLASVTEWATDQDPTAWPPARWTLARFNDRCD